MARTAANDAARALAVAASLLRSSMANSALLLPRASHHCPHHRLDELAFLGVAAAAGAAAGRTAGPVASHHSPPGRTGWLGSAAGVGLGTGGACCTGGMVGAAPGWPA